MDKIGECLWNIQMQIHQLIFSSSLFFGGIPIDLAPPAGAMSALTFFGCIRQIQINGFDLAKELPFIHPNIKIMVQKFASFKYWEIFKMPKKLLKNAENYTGL